VKILRPKTKTGMDVGHKSIKPNPEILIQKKIQIYMLYDGPSPTSSTLYEIKFESLSENKREEL
jgi:hypothetical protein